MYQTDRRCIQKKNLQPFSCSNEQCAGKIDFQNGRLETKGETTKQTAVFPCDKCGKKHNIFRELIS